MDRIDAIIDTEHHRICNLLKGGMLYGRPLDIDNVKQLVVAAYYSGLCPPAITVAEVPPNDPS